VSPRLADHVTPPDDGALDRAHFDGELERVLDLVREYLPSADMGRIHAAYAFS